MIYFEFKGKKLSGTDCYTYQEAKYVLFKIVDQCISTYKKKYNKHLTASEELYMYYKILSKLQMVVSNGRSFTSTNAAH